MVTDRPNTLKTKERVYVDTEVIPKFLKAGR